MTKTSSTKGALIENDPKAKRYMTWLKKMKCKEAPVALAEFADTGRGLMVTKDLAPNTDIIVIPRHVLLNIETIGPLYAPAYQKESPSISAHQLLALHLALERQQGPKSNLYPFIESLPTDFDTLPLTWPQEMIESGPWWFQDQVAEQRKKFVHDLDQVMAFSSSSDIVIELHLEDFQWSWLCVNTRCLYMEGLSSLRRDNMTMAPLIDMVNHDAQAGTDVNIRDDGFAFHTLPNKSYNAGEELKLPYGPHDNSFLLVEYGFTIPMNSCNHVKVDKEVNSIAEEHGKLEALAELQKDDYYGDWSFDSDPSFRLLVALRWLALHIDPAKASLIVKHVKGPKAHKVKEIDRHPSLESIKAFKQMLRGERDLISEENEASAKSLLKVIVEKVQKQANDCRRRIEVELTLEDDIRSRLIMSLWVDTLFLSKECIAGLDS